MTANKEEYLKVIYHHKGEHKPVSNKKIATTLNVAPSSVTEMLPKLQKDGLVTVKPYKGTQLTAKGLKVALNLIRSCSLWEVFLVKHLNYNWKDAIEESQHLEHYANPRLLDKLDEFLDYPVVCPHGSVIPRQGTLKKREELICLESMKRHEKGIIKQVLEEPELLSYLERMEIALGLEVEILETSDYDGPVKIKSKDKEISLSLKAAKGIYIEKMQ